MWRLLLVPPSVLAWQAAKAALDSAEALMVQGNLEPAMQKYFEACKTRRALQEETPPDHPLLLPGDGSFRRAGRQKLRHDAEQLEHLVQLQLLPARPFSQVAQVFRQVLEQLPEDLAVVDVGAGVSKAMDRIYNRAVYLTHPGRLPGPALALSAAEAEALRGRFRASELPAEASGCEAQNGVAFADNVLSPAALDALQRWCRESTMWFSTRAGYVAAFMQEAFNAPLLVQLVEELRRALPDVLGPHQLMNMWAFKYSNNASDWPLEGTAVHADVAAVNVNLWLTSDEANEDPDGGGLIVYTKQAPRDWGFADYNSLNQVPKIQEYLKDSEQIHIPHRQNRLVLFNSNLFHETQRPHFRPGYTKRRINLTFLFGRRCNGLRGTNEGPGKKEL